MKSHSIPEFAPLGAPRHDTSIAWLKQHIQTVESELAALKAAIHEFVDAHQWSDTLRKNAAIAVLEKLDGVKP